MEIKKLPAPLMAAALFLVICRALYAQEVGYYIEFDDDKPKFIQCLAWEEEEYALYYEVLIHVLDNEYREFSKDTTKDAYILVSLPPGKYRCSVTPYDLLETRGEPSEWKEFDVLHAFQPVISSFTPEVFYLDRILDRELRITGESLFEESEIYLKSELMGVLIPEKITIVSDTSAILFFDDMKLVPGNYDIYVNNPGGLSAKSGKFDVGYRKPLDFFLKLAYTPLIPVIKEDFSIDGSSMSFAGGSFSFEVVSSKRGDINGGLELAASVHYFNDAIDGYEMEYLYYLFDVNIILQKRFNRGRMAFSFRFGVGGGSLNYLETEENNIVMKFNLGFEYMVRLYKTLYFETGLDFNIVPSDGYPHFLRPKAGIVWQF